MGNSKQLPRIFRASQWLQVGNIQSEASELPFTQDSCCHIEPTIIYVFCLSQLIKPISKPTVSILNVSFPLIWCSIILKVKFKRWRRTYRDSIGQAVSDWTLAAGSLAGYPSIHFTQVVRYDDIMSSKVFTVSRWRHLMTTRLASPFRTNNRSGQPEICELKTKAWGGFIFPPFTSWLVAWAGSGRL